MTSTVSPAPADVELDDEELLELDHVDPRTLKLHKNVRFNPNVQDDQDFLASIRRKGVRTPIACWRDVAGDLHVLRGSRRTTGAVLMGRAKVPVTIEPEPDEADRIEDQVIENDQRAGLTAAEHVAAYEELALFGLSAEDIAERLSTPLPRVQAALRVGKIGEKARSLVASLPDVDLLQVGAMEEFAGDDSALATLAACIESGRNFDHQVSRLREDREIAAEKAAFVAACEAEGLLVLPESPGSEGPARALYYLKVGKQKRAKELTEKLHEGCPGRAVTVYQTWEPDPTRDDGRRMRVWKTTEYCTDYAANGHFLQDWATRTGAVEKDQAQKDREREERRIAVKFNALSRAATATRQAYLKKLVDLKKAPAGFGLMIATALTADQNIITWTNQRYSRYAHELFGLERPNYGTAKEFATLADGLSQARGDVMAMLLILAGYEDHLDVACWRTREGWVRRYLDFLESIGYELSDVERIAAGRLTVEQYEKDEAVAAAEGGK